MPRKLLPELQRNKDTARYAALGAEGSRTASRTTDANLESASIEIALLFVFFSKNDGEEVGAPSHVDVLVVGKVATFGIVAQLHVVDLKLTDRWT